MSLREIMATEGMLQTAGTSILDATLLVERMGGEMTHMNAGTWATFKNSKARDKAFDDLSGRGFTNLLKEGAKDIKFLESYTIDLGLCGLGKSWRSWRSTES